MFDKKMRSVQLCVLLALIASVVVYDMTLCTSAYTVHYSPMRATSGMMDFLGPGYCQNTDPAAHTMMPKVQSFQTSAYEVFSSNSFTQAPIGGIAIQAACLDTNCVWNFNHGLQYQNELTFFRGVYYNGQDKTASVDGVYNNFQKGVSPTYWQNVSYWGARQTVMKSGGYWGNVNVATPFTEWVCEYYKFDKSDSDIFPTYLNGDPIVPDYSNPNDFYHCGKNISRDSRNWFYDVKCGKSFPWWGGVVIACIVFLVVVSVIIITACCCLCCKTRKQENIREKHMEYNEDNQGQLPSQSQIGMSRSSAFIQGDDNYSVADQNFGY